MTEKSASNVPLNAPEGRFDEAALRRLPAKPKVTRFSKCCVHEFWAVVEKDGTLVRGRNVSQVNKLPGTGYYEVLFTHDVTDGVYVATLGRPGIFTEPPGEITLASRAGKPKGVWVETFNSTGNHQDHGFHLLVHTD